MTLHVFALNSGSVTQGVCSCGNWDGHVENHHFHARTQIGHNVKQPVDYLAEAKAAAAVDNQLAGTYALIAIAEAMQAASTQQLVAAAEVGAIAAAEAVATVANITMTGGNR